MHRGLHFAVQAIASVALVLAAYLFFGSTSAGSSLAGCGPQSGCDEVLSSRWAVWLGTPISLLAVVGYTVIFAAAAVVHFRGSGQLRQAAWLVLIVGSLLASGAAIWFLGLQLFVIGAFCPLCVTIHACGLTLAGLVYWLASFGPAQIGPDGELENRAAAVTRRQLGWSAVGAACGCGVLVSGQLLDGASQHQMIALSNTDQPVVISTLGILRVGAQDLDCREFPVLGSLGAPHVLVEFFDYTCPKCRSMHGYLQAAHQRYGDQLAVVLIPTPYESQCNPAVKAGRTHACELAALALGVWSAMPARFAEFHDWLHAGVRIPEIQQARDFASELVGPQALTQALHEVRRRQIVAQALALNDKVFRTAKANGGMCGDAVPKIAIGSERVLAGLPATMEEFFADLEQTLGLKSAEELQLERQGYERWNVKVTGNTAEFSPD